MTNTTERPDSEIEAIASISAALATLEDVAARRRVLSYVLARYFPEAATPATTHPSHNPSTPISSPNPDIPASRELPGIARLTETGELRLTARDLKAKSGLDAAVRLAHVAVYAHETLTGQPLSSSKGLTPLLKEWRLYDGNTRARIAKERGLIRSGDNLSLDAHARRDAEKYMQEIVNDEISGRWKPR